MRHVEKPMITQEMIYHHTEEPVDTNSEMSFLKLSETASNQLKQPNDDLFTLINTRINTMQRHSTHRLTQVQNNLVSLHHTVTNKRGGAPMCLIEENK
jgi:hypothetical protein